MTGDQVAASAGVRYQLFGGVRAALDGQALDLGGRKQRAVLAALLVDAGQVLPVDRLLDRVWGDAVPGRAVASLQAYISNLRRMLEPDRAPGQASSVIVNDAGGYRMSVGRDELDLTRFEDLHRAGLEALAAGDLETGVQKLTQATALFGPVMPELASDPWVRDLQSRLDGLHADALEAFFEARLGLGQSREILGDIEAAVAAHPFREGLRAQLALALYRSGRQADALRALAETRRTLSEEIGVAPGPGLERLEADILHHAPHLEAPAHRAPAHEGRSLEVSTHEASLDQAPPLGRQQRRGVDLVGREGELAALVEAARAAAHGRGGAAVISGEAGIGKTRLVEELVARCPTRSGGGLPSGWPEGLVVTRTRSPESASASPGSTCIQLFKQVVVAGVLDPAAVRHATEQAEASMPPSGLVDPGTERYEFHAAAATVLRSARSPLLLVVDDLQWADPSSLRLLEFLAGELPNLPVLLVVTVRPLGPEPPPALVACLGELARHSSTPRIELRGLGLAEIGQWMHQRAGTVDPGVVDLVHARTSGNPFFVGEVIELLAGRGGFADLGEARRLGVPAAVQDAVRQRVDRLPSETRKLLGVAAVLGVAVDTDLLARMAGTSLPAAVEALDPAVDIGVLVADHEVPGRLRFSHALVADVLVRELPLSRRTRLHAAAVEAIEELRSADRDEHLGDLAHHAAEGAVAGTAVAAFDYMTQAARLAATRRAYDDAVAYWERAGRVVELARPGDLRARLEVALELARAQTRVGDSQAAQAATLEAIKLAGAFGEPAVAREAAAGLPAMIWLPTPYGATNPELVAALERTLDQDPAAPPAQRADVLGAAADLLYYEDAARAGAWSIESLAAARQAGEPEALARALSRRLVALWRPGTVTESEELVAELVDLAETYTELPADLTGVAYLSRGALALERGKPAPFEADLARSRELADRSRSPGLATHVGWVETAWLLGRGRYPEARAAAQETYILHRRTRRWDAEAVYAAHMSWIVHDQGEPDAAQADLAVLFDDSTEYAAGMRELLALMLTERGELDRARSLIGPVGTVPDAQADWLWLALTGLVAHVRSALGDVEASRVVYDRLGPHRGRLLIAGPGGPILGPVDLALARLARTLGDLDAAWEHLAPAVEMLERMQLRPWLARARLTRYELLAASDAPADRDAAAAELEACRNLAVELGLVPVLAALERAVPAAS